ncbi:hypothetical protein [Roseomonas sp. WA12]
MPLSGGLAMWRPVLGGVLLLVWAVPEAAWPAGLGRAIAAFWALMPAAVSAGMAWSFARTLRAGQEPLIARYTRFDETRDSQECAGYARGLTLFWAVVLGMAAVLELGCFAAGVEPGWVPDLVLLGLFLGEHAVRSLRFPAGGIAWPTQTLRAIIRAERAGHA